MITDTMDGRVKLAYANGLTDEQIAEQEDIPISTVEQILSRSRLPIKITGIGIDLSKSLITIFKTTDKH